jgi:hypothetical protein
VNILESFARSGA